MTLLAYDKLTTLENFGHSLRAPVYRYTVTRAEEIADIFRMARQQGRTVTLRGAGRSYNDAALNSGGIVVDTSGMKRILEWNPETGRVTAEPGVTLQQLWQHILPDGWWPPVVSGTMYTTLGGCLSANIHGKNNFQLGPIGEHVLEFTALLAGGAEVTCSPRLNGDLFRALIGGMGLLGAFTTMTLQMKRVHSGLLDVRAWPARDLREQLDFLYNDAPKYDYIVGWLDATARGGGLGRGQLHAARYLHAGEDAQAEQTLRVDYQTLPATLFGVFPKASIHYFMAPFMVNLGAWGVNTAKFLMSLRAGRYKQTHAAFHFLLDYVPNWERAYGRGGLIQYQSFVPRETALDAWTEMLALSHQRGLPSYLGVTKRHRPDGFLLSHAVDGFSLALDFKVTDGSRARLAQLLQDFDRIILNAGGRFYFAKNSETTPETAQRFLGKHTLERFRKLKQRCDPDDILESDLYRRVFG
jgi:FAD/FMN-containing dehydrogenase